MEEIIFENELYYFKDGIIYDEFCCKVTKELSDKILKDYYNKTDFTKFDENKLINFIKNLKNSQLYLFCLKISIFGLEKFENSDKYIITVLPIITSCYRLMGESQKAIDFWNQNKNKYKSFISVALLTSLAAAYCDLNNYLLAKKYADRAYCIQKGGKGYTTELSLVYERIRKETNLFMQ